MNSLSQMRNQGSAWVVELTEVLKLHRAPNGTLDPKRVWPGAGMLHLGSDRQRCPRPPTLGGCRSSTHLPASYTSPSTTSPVTFIQILARAPFPAVCERGLWVGPLEGNESA